MPHHVLLFTWTCFYADYGTNFYQILGSYLQEEARDMIPLW